MEEHKNTLHWLPEFRPGMLLEVLTQDNRLLLVGKVDWGQGDTLQLCDCNGMELPYIEYDTEVKLRGFSSAGPFVLKGQVMGNTKEFWRIENLWSLQSPERREYFRQSSSLEASATRVTRQFRTVSEEAYQTVEEPVPCRVMNLSASGAMIHARAEFQEGDWISLTGVKVLPEEPAFSFVCHICWMQERGGMADYGCEFYRLSRNEQDRLIRGILDMQRRNLKARREDTMR